MDFGIFDLHPVPSIAHERDRSLISVTREVSAFEEMRPTANIFDTSGFFLDSRLMFFARVESTRH